KNMREPFDRLLTQGMVIKDGAKMSKSIGNVVDPDEIISKYGADTARLFILFASPPERDLEWSEQGVEGAYRFLCRVYRVVETNLETLKSASKQPILLSEIEDLDSRSMKRMTHSTLSRVTKDISEGHQFNTAVARLMELTNALAAFKVKDSQSSDIMREGVETLLVCLSTFAPHIAEELWHLIGNKTFISTEKWHIVDESALVKDSVTIVLQINGKVREQFSVEPDLSKDELEKEILSRDETKKRLEGVTVVRVIVVPGKLVNVVVKA
ncbi:MAG: class I tRNA ligase family protein, partial [Synergistaceae bacterium]|nr:class I tRNA ligase family protein [Synergistaceae bacterium]